MYKKNKIGVVIVAVIALLITNCKPTEKESGKLKVVTTTTMITDLVKKIGGDKIDVKGLMGAGVDPHLYKATEGDMSKLFTADVVIYNGLHLEGKLEEVFEKMRLQNKKIIAVSNSLDKSKLISSANFASNYDPHIWFNTTNWIKITSFLANQLAELDPKNAEVYKLNAGVYLKELHGLNNQINSIIKELPKEKRILVTAHDAFNYFGEQHGFDVVGLQGLSTATEAGVQDVQKLANFIIEKKIKAIFIESSVPKRTIEALQEAVKAKNHQVIIGGTLYSDALGSEGTEEGEYIGMYKHNVNTIVGALK